MEIEEETVSIENREYWKPWVLNLCKEGAVGREREQVNLSELICLVLVQCEKDRGVVWSFEDVGGNAGEGTASIAIELNSEKGAKNRIKITQDYQEEVE